MFTGIVEKTGKLKKIEKKTDKVYFIIEVDKFLNGVKIGDSISCDGTCLTVVKKTKNIFTVELMPETLRLTKFIDSKIGDEINLEKASKIGDRINGHFVSGHVDCVGVLKKIIKEGKYFCFAIRIPGQFSKFLAYKGSVSVNGVSLTIAESKKDIFKICLITHTLNITNLSDLKIGDKVNIEVDLIARYLEKMLEK